MYKNKRLDNKIGTLHIFLCSILTGNYMVLLIYCSPAFENASCLVIMLAL